MLDTLIAAAKQAQRAGAWDEALARYEDAFSRLSAEGSASTAADILRWIGTVHRERGNLEVAQELYEASLAVAEANGLGWQTADALNVLASIEHLRGDLEQAEHLYTRARTLADEVGYERLVAIVDQNLGILAAIRGDLVSAIARSRSALDRYRNLDDGLSVARTLNNLGMVHVDLQEWDDAEGCFEEALEQADRAEDTLMVGTVELNRADLYLQRERYPLAQRSCDRALDVFNQLRSRSSVAEVYKFYGIFYRETGKTSQADTHLALSLGMAEVCEDLLLQAETQMEWALLHLEEQRQKEGIKYLNRALEIFIQLQAQREVMDIERRLDRLQQLYLPAIERWGAEMSESGDPFLAGHARRVADYASMLGEAVGVAGADLVWLRVAALVHDIGNVALPDEILIEADELDDADPGLLHVHAIMGDALATEMRFPPSVRPVIRNHHEHWAGTGYPDRLRGEEIPLNARIVRITDAYDTLTSGRSSRPALTPSEAACAMERDGGRIYDPELLRAFLAIVRGAPQPVIARRVA